MDQELRLTDQVHMAPADILTGLGASDRQLLATCLALFDDSKLTQRMSQLYKDIHKKISVTGEKVSTSFEKLKGHRLSAQMTQVEVAIALPNLNAIEIKEATEDVRNRQVQWFESPYSDDQLRLLLWIRLRESLGLEARLSANHRGMNGLADDLVARLIHMFDPLNVKKDTKRWLQQRGWLDKTEQALSLADIVLPVLDELLEKSHKDEPDALSQQDRHRMIVDAVASLRQMNQAERQALLNTTGTKQMNDEAIRNALLLGGSLSAFSIGVGSVGFSAYILAAQASALIPLATGPGLVSLVSVLANPITVVGLTGVGTWWAIRSARERVNAAIASRVIALLTISGLKAGREYMKDTLRSFSLAPQLEQEMGLRPAVIAEYQSEYFMLGELWQSPTPIPEPLLRTMQCPVYCAPSSLSAAGNHSDSRNERVNAAVMATMTVGDILYAAAAVDPAVIQAADFSRIADIDGPISFSMLAEDILAGTDTAVTGGVSQLKGYVAERAVAQQLAAQGHSVSFPGTSNQPGFDLLIDGQPFQVKFHESLSGLRQHFERYDYPVIANTELIGQIPEALQDKVFFIEGLSESVVEQITTDSLQAGAEMLDTSPLTMACFISAARGVLAYRHGQLSASQVIEQVLVDGTVRAGLAGSGALAGATIGALILGPAGGLVLTNLAPILAIMHTKRFTGFIRRNIRGDSHRLWQTETHACIDALQKVTINALERKYGQIVDTAASAPNNQAGQYLRWRLADDARFVKECQCRLAALYSQCHELPEQRAKSLLQAIAISRLHPALYQPEMRKIEKQLKTRPGIEKLLDPKWMAELASDVGDIRKDKLHRVGQWATDHDLTNQTRQWAKRFSRRKKDPHT